MTKILPWFAFALLGLCLAGVAKAEFGDWYVVPTAVYTDDDGNRNIDDSIAGGQINFGRAVSEHFSLEGVLGYSDIAGFPGQEHFEAGINVLGFLDREKTFSPYLLAGAGYLGTELDGLGDENRPTATVGAGFQWSFGDEFLSIRAEHRARFALEKNNSLTDGITTLGLQFSFGDDSTGYFASSGNAEANSWQHCLDTGSGAVGGEYGCEPDEDADGVFESDDVCPGTIAGVLVDEFGCRPDINGDGVADDRDSLIR